MRPAKPSRFIDKTGATVFELPWAAYPLSNGMALICSLGANAKYGYINKSGEVVVEPQYESAGSFSEGLAYVAISLDISRKYGYIDKSGKAAIWMEFNSATSFSEGLAAIRIGSNWGFINARGKVVIKPRASEGGQLGFSEGLSAYTKDKRWGFINKKGKFIIKPGFAAVKSFSQGLAAAKDVSSDEWGYIDQRGNWAIKPMYKIANKFKDNRAVVTDQYGSKRAIDRNANTVVNLSQFKPRVIETDFHYSEGLLALKVINVKEDKWGFIDENGQMIIEPKFERCIPPSFSEELCAVNFDGKNIFIDRAGESVIETDADVVGDFSEGLAVLSYLH